MLDALIVAVVDADAQRDADRDHHVEDLSVVLDVDLGASVAT